MRSLFFSPLQDIEDARRLAEVDCPLKLLECMWVCVDKCADFILLSSVWCDVPVSIVQNASSSSLWTIPSPENLIPEEEFQLSVTIDQFQNLGNLKKSQFSAVIYS